MFRDTKILKFALFIFNAIPLSDADLANYSSGLIIFFYDYRWNPLAVRSLRIKPDQISISRGWKAPSSVQFD